MRRYKFRTDERGNQFCDEIVHHMVSLFGISKEEATARINQEWKNEALIGINIVYHVVPEEWAKDIYWGHDSYWWIEGEKPEQLKLSPLTPKPLRRFWRIW
ncbi:MAG TPA: hypothetical protein VKP08_08330 [Anaerolineales bacterium]|nr:hypothetical protein [Anaerolineales bacterium]